MEDGKDSIRLHIVEQSSGNYGSTFFEPQRDMPGTPRETCHSLRETGQCSRSQQRDDVAPERKLTVFALQLAVFEKAASGLGTLGFIWATVVLLGGFAIALGKKDFWTITIILLVEGARIFSRSHELEWQHQATWSLAEAGRSSFRAIKSSSQLLLRSLKFMTRPLASQSADLAHNVRVAGEETAQDALALRQRWAWRACDVPLFYYTGGWDFVSQNISRVLYWLQLLAASACVSLSLMRLVQQDFGELRPDDPDKKNRKAALNIFYGLALAEALLFLAEKAYWEWRVSYWMLLEEVTKECHLGTFGLVSIRRFFYDAYSKCVEGSVFDGLKMDLVSFAEELLASSSRDEQLIGARILHKFSTSHRFADRTLRKLGTSTAAIERLIEMLNWTNSSEEEIRRSAAIILSKLAGKKRNALRVAGIPGAMESISSLLYTGRGSSDAKPDEICGIHQVDHDVSAFSLLGLLILKKLANDHDNCGKIGNTRGLLAKIVDFTGGCRGLAGGQGATESKVKAMKRALQVVKKLVSTTGNTGKTLRQEISEIVFTVSNIREILHHGESHLMLQKLGIEIIASLAMDDEARERIGNTGGMLKGLLTIFFRDGVTEEHSAVRLEAGEALAMLALESKSNCYRILKEEHAVESLVEALDHTVLRISSARILRNLCKHAGEEHLYRLRKVTAGISTVLSTIITEENKLLEVSLGLVTEIFRFMSSEECRKNLENVGIGEVDFAERLVQILKKYNSPSIKVPRIRRFVVELVIWMMEYDANYAIIFNDIGMKQQLEHVSETTSELECFNVFSGSVGLSRHGITLCSLVDTAIQLMSTSGN